ncbi:MAG: translation initiation factor IF-3 [Phycisphaerales bacterium]|nr:translation initiation factor IF-3 [Phycisphaerales bacterium]MCB9856412.1 translation initiation factor IF-3 [Phycisphaerales bacterium]MCB9864543.1 translation initiation factor IF-3 [Phycisphaerales bacterium]
MRTNSKGRCLANIRLRTNEQIRISPVRLVDQDGGMVGIVPTAEALRQARDVGLDLVEMSPNERPPVCKIMDYGKHKYELSKKQKQKHHEQKIKEIRVRPKTDEHDLEIKLNRARKFLEHGDRVQVTMLFRGRERFRQDLAREQFDDIVKELADIAKVDRHARSMGRRMTLMLAPIKAAPVHKKPTQKPKPKPPVDVEALKAAAAAGAAQASADPKAAETPADEKNGSAASTESAQTTG